LFSGQAKPTELTQRPRRLGTDLDACGSHPKHLAERALLSPGKHPRRVLVESVHRLDPGRGGGKSWPKLFMESRLKLLTLTLTLFTQRVKRSCLFTAEELQRLIPGLDHSRVVGLQNLRLASDLLIRHFDLTTHSRKFPGRGLSRRLSRRASSTRLGLLSLSDLGLSFSTLFTREMAADDPAYRYRSTDC
jgi:hypothetical protein